MSAPTCVCLRNPGSMALTIRSALASYHLRTITGLNQACDPQRLDAYDVIVTQRGAFLRFPPAVALSLILKLETDALKQLKLVLAADLQAAEEAERNAIENNKKDIETGGRKGYSLVLLKTIPQIFA